MLITSKSIYEINKLKAQLNSEFEMKYLGAAKKNLGMEIHRDRSVRKLCLSQKKYIDRVLERFGKQNVKPMSTPLIAHFRLSAVMSPQNDEEKEHMICVPYASAVGSMMYAMVCTRPYISHTISVISRYMGNSCKLC